LKHTAAIQIANAPCSWGLIGMGEPAVSWRRMLDEMRAAGYSGTELGDYGFLPVDPAELASELKQRGLSLLGAYFAVNLTEPGEVQRERRRLQQLVELLAAAESSERRPWLVLADADGRDPVRLLNAGRIEPSMGMNREQWGTLVANTEELARIALDSAGIKTVFHPHCGSYIETPAETEQLLDSTDRDLIGLVLDTGHYVYGSGCADEDGLTAARGLQKFRERVSYVHFKDVNPHIAARARSEGWQFRDSVREGLFCELGRGSIDFGAVLAGLVEYGYCDWITVEQDVLPGMGTPLESAHRNRTFLGSLGL